MKKTSTRVLISLLFMSVGLFVCLTTFMIHKIQHRRAVYLGSKRGNYKEQYIDYGNVVPLITQTISLSLCSTLLRCIVRSPYMLSFNVVLNIVYLLRLLKKRFIFPL